MRLQTANLIVTALLVASPALLVSENARGGDQPADLPRLGTNLDEIVDWGTMLPFNDLFKTSRPWISGNSATFQFDDGRPLDLDANGWVRSLLPDQVARTIMLIDDVTTRVGSGRYVVTYAGQGELDYSGEVAVLAREPGRDLVEVRSSAAGGLFMHIFATNPADYIRDIRVVREAVAAGGSPATFADAFLARLGSYRVLRFMDWGRTNLTALERWDERPEPSDARWSLDTGVPLEVMIDLANETCSEPWFNIPHRADDEYVRNAAQLIHERLAPDLRVWVEYSNETWNGIFEQAAYVDAQGLALGLSDDAFIAGRRFHSRRSVEIFRIFAQEFAGARQLQRVMGGFVTVPFANQVTLEFEDAYLETDALAIAPYFGHEWGTDRVQETRQMTVAQLLAKLRGESMPSALALCEENRVLADKFGVGLVAYEGGHHLNAPQLGAGDPVHAKFFAAARHAEMGAIYSDYLAAWRDIASSPKGGTFVNFTLCGAFSNFGCWSVLEFITQAPTPREQALAGFVAGESRPICTGTRACPGDLDADGSIGASDLASLLVAWGSQASGSAADINGDGVVSGADLTALLVHWGPCAP